MKKIQNPIIGTMSLFSRWFLMKNINKNMYLNILVAKYHILWYNICMIIIQKGAENKWVH